MENWDWTHLLKFSVAFYSNHNFTEFSSDLLSGEKKKKDKIQKCKVLWYYQALLCGGKKSAMNMKAFGTQCWVYEKLLPELYDIFAWCTKCILIILKHGNFDL